MQVLPSQQVRRGHLGFDDLDVGGGISASNWLSCETRTSTFRSLAHLSTRRPVVRFAARVAHLPLYRTVHLYMYLSCDPSPTPGDVLRQTTSRLYLASLDVHGNLTSVARIKVQHISTLSQQLYHDDLVPWNSSACGRTDGFVMQRQWRRLVGSPGFSTTRDDSGLKNGRSRL